MSVEEDGDVLGLSHWKGGIGINWDAEGLAQVCFGEIAGVVFWTYWVWAAYIIKVEVSNRQLDMDISCSKKRCGLEMSMWKVLTAMKKPLQLWPWVHHSPLRTSVPSWIVSRCSYLWARPPMESDNELPSFLVSPHCSLFMQLDSSPIGGGKPEAWCFPASSVTAQAVPLFCLLPQFKFSKFLFHSKA